MTASYLLDLGVDADGDEKGHCMTPLFVALKMDSLFMVQEVPGRRANVNKRSNGTDGTLYSHLGFCRRGKEGKINLEIEKLLTFNGATT